MSAQFLYAVCQVGAEPALKEEVSARHPDLAFAFSRPGFVTFKNRGKDLPEDFELGAVFARAWGFSTGKSKGALPERVREAKRRLQELRPERLHVFERDLHKAGDEPMGFVPGQRAEAALSALGDPGVPQGEAAMGERVFDLVIVEEDEWWFGEHRQGPDHSSFPGGRPRISLPPDAPSRAYLKLETALLWSRAPLKAGDTAVEIGAAPGGAAYALLQRGLKVVGIDPGEMHPIVLRHPNYQHFGRPVADVLRESLPRDVHWLLLDMNVAPTVSLYAVDRYTARMKESLLGVLLTVKLNQWSMAKQIPDWLAHIKSMGMVKVRATQLASNRQEIFIYGLTRKGAMRK